jgi:hypothetical protein
MAIAVIADGRFLFPIMEIGYAVWTFHILIERPELRHAGPNDVNREAELDRPSRVACSDLLGGILVIVSLFLETPREHS